MQQYEPTKFKGTPDEKKALMVEVGHLLNRLRMLADESESPLSNKEEDVFWKFISTLPANAQTSIIN